MGTSLQKTVDFTVVLPQNLPQEKEFSLPVEMGGLLLTNLQTSFKIQIFFGIYGETGCPVSIKQQAQVDIEYRIYSSIQRLLYICQAWLVVDLPTIRFKSLVYAWVGQLVLKLKLEIELTLQWVSSHLVVQNSVKI